MIRFAALALFSLAACTPRPAARPAATSPRGVQLDEQSSGTAALLQAVSVVDENVVWISGHRATVVRSTDGGRTWTQRPVAGAPDSLQFRDIEAHDARTAWILAAGPGDMSRIYRTDDGGATWTLQWTNPETSGFYDCLAFWDEQRGIVYGDAVDGQLRVLLTDDGGRNWRLASQAALPAAQPGEGGFAASGLCVETRPGGHAWIATGNAARARVLHSTDFGRTWAAAEAAVVSGEASGLTSIVMTSDTRGFAFGGNLAVNDRATDNVVATRDGGRTWSPLPHVSFNGAIYGGVHAPASSEQSEMLAIAGPAGFAHSFDGGATWRTDDTRAWWGIGTSASGATWIAGPEGRIARVVAVDKIAD